MQHLWTRARCEDPFPAEEDVWVCDICLPRNSEVNSCKRKPSLCLWFSCSRQALQGEGKNSGQVHASYLPFSGTMQVLYSSSRVSNLTKIFFPPFLVEFCCRKQQQQEVMDREFSSCGTPTGLDSRNEPFDLRLGGFKILDMPLFREIPGLEQVSYIILTLWIFMLGVKHRD